MVEPAAERPIVVRTRSALATTLSNWPNEPENSWALCCVWAEADALSVSTIRAAAKVCDRVAVVRLLPGLPPPTMASVVGAAGADVLWVPDASPTGLLLALTDAHGVQVAEAGTATLLLQAVATVLPLAVFVPRTRLAEVRLVRALAVGLGEMANIELV
jgi:hypothetical protein